MGRTEDASCKDGDWRGRNGGERGRRSFDVEVLIEVSFLLWCGKLPIWWFYIMKELKARSIATNEVGMISGCKSRELVFGISNKALIT